MNRRTREELKESLKWIRWKKYRKKVSVVGSELKGIEWVVTLRDDNKKIFKNVKIKTKLWYRNRIENIIKVYINKQLGYSYVIKGEE